MEDSIKSTDDIRSLSEEELTKLAEDGLTNLLRDQGENAKNKLGKLSPENLDNFFADRKSVRYPTRRIMKSTGMEAGLFGHVEIDPENSDSRLLFLRAELAERPELLPRAVAYLIPVINFGEVITDKHCVTYGAHLFGETEEEFYQSICKLADWLGSLTP